MDGKKLLFEDDSSLFNRLRRLDPPVELIREIVAGGMTADEIHEDVHRLFAKLKALVAGSGSR